MLVAVLPACTSSRVPFYLEVALVKTDLADLKWVNYCDGHRRRVNSSLAFSGWDSLDSMPA